MPNPFDGLAAALADLQTLLDALDARVAALEGAEAPGLVIETVEIMEYMPFNDGNYGRNGLDILAPAGMKALGGGGTVGNTPRTLVLVSSRPIPSGWHVEFQDIRAQSSSIGGYEVPVWGYAVCTTASEGSDA